MPKNNHLLNTFYRATRTRRLTTFNEELISHLQSICSTETLSKKDLSNLLFIFKYLNVSWKDIQKYSLDAPLISALKLNLPSLTHKEFSTTLWQLANIGLTWDILTHNELDKLIQDAINRNILEFSPQDLSIILWSLAHLELPSSQLNKYLLQAIEKPVEYTLKDIHQICIAKLWFNLTFSPRLQTKVKTIIASDKKPESSTTHLRIAGQIKKLTDEPFVNEQCFEDTLWVDIYFPRKKLVIEIDGPSHRAHLDLFKDKLLTKIDVRVARISLKDTQPLEPYDDDIKLLLQTHNIALIGDRPPIPIVTAVPVISDSIHRLGHRHRPKIKHKKQPMQPLLASSRYYLLAEDTGASSADIVETTPITPKSLPQFSIGNYINDLIAQTFTEYTPICSAHLKTLRILMKNLFKELKLPNALSGPQEEQVKTLLTNTLYKKSIIASIFSCGEYRVNIVTNEKLKEKFLGAVRSIALCRPSRQI